MPAAKPFLGNKALLLCLATAICSKLLLQYHFFAFDGDEVLQALAAKSLQDGAGLSLPVVRGAALSTLVHVPLRAWPPGYSLLVLPFYLLCNDLVKSTLLVDGFATLCFFVFYFLLLRQLRFSTPLVCLLLLFNGVFLSQDLVFSSPTDLISLAALLSLFYYFIRLVRRNHYTAWYGILLAALCVLPAFFRYLYLPVAFVIPPLLCWQGLVTKNRAQVTSGLIAFAGVVVFCVALFVYIKTADGVIGNNPSLQATPPQLHLRNILHTNPFLFSGIVNLDFVLQQLSQLTGYTYQTLLYAIFFVHWFVLFFVLLFLIRFIKASKPLAQQTAEALLFSAGLIACFFIVVSLLLLSATTPLITNPEAPILWTYVQEERYYKFLAVFLPVLVFYYLSRKGGHNKIKKLLFYSLFFIMAIETVHGFYFIGRRVLPQLRTQKQEAFENRHHGFLKNFIATQQQLGRTVVLAGTLNTFFWYARGYNIKPLLNIRELNQPLFAAQPTAVLVALSEAALPKYQRFFATNVVKPEGKIDNTRFFSVYLKGNERN